MTILTILLFISCILFLIGYRKERSRRIALEGEVKSFTDKTSEIWRSQKYDINKLLDGAEKVKTKAWRASDVRKLLTKKENDALDDVGASIGILDFDADSAIKWIYGAFVWSNTKQGNEFWAGVCDRLKNIESEEKAKPKAMTAPIVKDKKYYDRQKNIIMSKIAESVAEPIVKDFDESMKYNIGDKVKIDGKIVTVSSVSNPIKVLPKIPRGYKRHDGGKRPVSKNTNVAVIFSGGATNNLSKASRWTWEHYGHAYDIIAYKVVKPKTMKRTKK